MKTLNNAMKMALLGTVATGVMMIALPDDAKADAYALTQVDVRQLTLSGLPGFGGRKSVGFIYIFIGVALRPLL